MIDDFSLKEIIQSGQLFRWEILPDGTYLGVTNGSVYRLKSERQANLNNWLYRYFDLERDYSEIKKNLSREDSVMRDAINSCPGMRIVKQDMWETMVSFIISQNNNIPRIKKSIHELCKAYGRHIEDDFHEVPLPEVLAELTVEDLEDIKLGYRAEYLIETAKRYVRLGLSDSFEPVDDMKKLAEKEGMDILDFLMTFKGVGMKVANCIALYGMNIVDACPIDTWMKKAMHELYGFREDDIEGMKYYIKRHFSPHAGMAQQYLFYYIRKLNGSLV